MISRLGLSIILIVTGLLLLPIGASAQFSPTPLPTSSPTSSPTILPSTRPTATPTVRPTASPTLTPSPKPTGTPTISPTLRPTNTPTPSPSPTPRPLDVNVTAPISNDDDTGYIDLDNSIIIGVHADGTEAILGTTDYNANFHSDSIDSSVVSIKAVHNGYGAQTLGYAATLKFKLSILQCPDVVTGKVTNGNQGVNGVGVVAVASGATSITTGDITSQDTNGQNDGLYNLEFNDLNTGDPNGLTPFSGADFDLYTVDTNGRSQSPFTHVHFNQECGQTVSVNNQLSSTSIINTVQAAPAKTQKVKVQAREELSGEIGNYITGPATVTISQFDPKTKKKTVVANGSNLPFDVSLAVDQLYEVVVTKNNYTQFNDSKFFLFGTSAPLNVSATSGANPTVSSSSPYLVLVTLRSKGGLSICLPKAETNTKWFFCGPNARQLSKQSKYDVVWAAGDSKIRDLRSKYGYPKLPPFVFVTDNDIMHGEAGAWFLTEKNVDPFTQTQACPDLPAQNKNEPFINYIDRNFGNLESIYIPVSSINKSIEYGYNTTQLTEWITDAMTHEFGHGIDWYRTNCQDFWSYNDKPFTTLRDRGGEIGLFGSLDSVSPGSHSKDNPSETFAGAFNAGENHKNDVEKILNDKSGKYTHELQDILRKVIKLTGPQV